MDQLDKARRLGALVADLSSAGAQLAVSEDGKRMEVVGDAGPGIEGVIRANKEKLVEMLTGDPLSRVGWEGRTALYKQALRWLDERIPEEAKDHVTGVLCREDMLDSLNEAWCDGSFEEFKVTLRACIGAGRRAMKGRPSSGGRKTVDVGKTGAVEAELDNFIFRRHEKRVEEEGERLAEEMWAESERRLAARRREENRAAWCKYHEDQAARHRATLEALATYHESGAAKLQLEDAVVDGGGG